MAQNKFGYFSYKTVLDSLPQYKAAMESYDKLKQRCLKEVEHNEQELTRFYVAFLDGHREFPEPILRKRQKELQQLIDNGIVFRDQLKAWLRHAKDSLTASSRLAVDSALPRVCSELSLSYIIDTDHGGYKYINPVFGQDVTQDVISVILYPERLLRNIVECAEVVTDSVANDENMVLPATEIEIPATEIPATEMEVKSAEVTDKAVENTENLSTGLEVGEILNTNTEVTDSIDNR